MNTECGQPIENWTACRHLHHFRNLWLLVYSMICGQSDTLSRITLHILYNNQSLSSNFAPARHHFARRSQPVPTPIVSSLLAPTCHPRNSLTSEGALASYFAAPPQPYNTQYLFARQAQRRYPVTSFLPEATCQDSSLERFKAFFPTTTKYNHEYHTDSRRRRKVVVIGDPWE